MRHAWSKISPGSSPLFLLLPRKRGNSKIRVLSVDDDPVNQMVVQSLLSPDVYEVWLV